MNSPFLPERTRLSVAQEAARLMADEGISDFQAAKRKAAFRLGLDQRGALPSNQEIEIALVEHLRLFNGDEHPALILRRRRRVLGLMEQMEMFEPRLVGPLLAGTAAVDAPANLHMFSDSAEDVAWYLEDKAINYDVFERRLRVRRGQSQGFPAYRFDYEQMLCEVTVFPYNGLRQAPLSPVDSKPMPRASIKKVRKLIASHTAEAAGN